MKQAIRIMAVTLAIISLIPFPATATNAQDALPVIIDSCIYGQTANLSDYNFTEGALDSTVDRLMSEGALPWYFTGAYNYRYAESSGTVLEFTPENLDPQKYDRTLYEQKLAEVMDRCICDGMNAVQIALSVHDYLIVNCVYDESLESNTAYDLLINGTTVCAGYTDLYMDILNRAGVPCRSVTSQAMEHTWNLVQIDGAWYHVDVTWDDPTPDSYGFVSHQYFLLTDEQIAQGEKPHYEWDTDIVCNDTRFTDAYWKDVQSPILFENCDFSYLLRSEDFTNYICRHNENTGTVSILYTDKEHYIDIGYGRYTYQHQGLSLRNGRLWFGTLDAVCSITPAGSDRRTDYQFKSPDTYLYSFSIAGDILYMTTADHNGNTTAATTELPASQAHIHSYTKTVQPPQCEAGGYTTSVCSCGLTCQSDLTAPTGHTMAETKGKSATLFRSGFSDRECTVCGYAQTLQLPQLTLVQWLSKILSRLSLIPAPEQVAINMS